jgi:hypothetical protein
MRLPDAVKPVDLPRKAPGYFTFRLPLLIIVPPPHSWCEAIGFHTPYMQPGLSRQWQAGADTWFVRSKTGSEKRYQWRTCRCNRRLNFFYERRK